jgi:hypothetical protein
LYILFSFLKGIRKTNISVINDRKHSHSVNTVTLYENIFGLLLLFERYPCDRYEGPNGCELLRLPHFLDNRLTDGSEVVSLAFQQPFTPRNIPGTHFC